MCNPEHEADGSLQYPLIAGLLHVLPGRPCSSNLLYLP
jgi:hypothetical protein